MKGLRFLLLGISMCLTSGVKAQFYDSADDIYYYLKCDKNGQIDEGDLGRALIFNFDGKNACVLCLREDEYQLYPPYLDYVQNIISQNPNYLLDRISNGVYDTKHVSGNTYIRKGKYNYNDEDLEPSYRYGSFEWTLKFSNDRKTLDLTIWYNNQGGYSWTESSTYKQVDKSFLKVGRSRK